MKKFLILIAIFVTTNLFAQQDKIYTSLDEALKNPTQVYHLNLSGQGLTKVPKGFKDMVNLKTIDLSNNKLSDLPSFSSFDHLESVNLSNNNFNWTPSFIELKTGDRNLIAENNPFTNFIPSTEKEVQLPQKGFEGTIRMKSGATFETSDVAEINSSIKILYEGTESEYWINIKKRNNETNESIIEKIKENDVFEFNYSVNAHITMNSSGEIPEFFVYAYTDRTENIGMTSANFVVFYGEYYITGGSLKRSTAYYYLRKSLAIALTYKPKDDGITVSMNEIAFKIISPAEFVKANTALQIKPVNSSLPQLPVNKETIYTLQAGETVAFTNEYQIGVDLKEDQYYIYLKKGNKYYIKTATRTWGPYDNLNTASPQASRGTSFVYEFEVTKGNQSYYISDGKEIGPFPLRSGIFYVENQKLIVIRYETEAGTFTYFNGAHYGPYADSWYPEVLNGHQILADKVGEKKDIYKDGVKIHSQIETGAYRFVFNNQLIFDFKQDEKRYVQINDQTFGPYGSIQSSDVRFVDGTPAFTYYNDKKEYIYFHGQHYGPFDKVYFDYYKALFGYFISMQGNEYYVHLKDKKYGPLVGGIPMLYVNHDTTNYMINYGTTGANYIIHNGKSFGPFNRVWTLKDEITDRMSSTDILPTGTVQDLNDEHWVFLENKKYGPFKTVPYTLRSDDGKKIAFVISEKNASDKLEYYLLSGEQKIGPFSHAGDYYTQMGNYITTADLFSGEKLLITPTQIYGPYEKIEIVKDDEAELEFMYKNKGEWFYYLNNSAIGPIKPANEAWLTKFGADYILEHGQMNETVSYETATDEFTKSRINNIDFESDYEVIANNGNNYVAVEQFGERTFVVNNVEYKDKNILNFSYHETTKKFYWLTLEGKSIVRNSVQL